MQTSQSGLKILRIFPRVLSKGWFGLLTGISVIIFCRDQRLYHAFLTMPFFLGVFLNLFVKDRYVNIALYCACGFMLGTIMEKSVFDIATLGVLSAVCLLFGCIRSNYLCKTKKSTS